MGPRVALWGRFADWSGVMGIEPKPASFTFNNSMTCRRSNHGRKLLATESSSQWQSCFSQKKAQPAEVAPQKGNTKLHAQNNSSVRPFNTGVLWKKTRGCPGRGQAGRSSPRLQRLVLRSSATGPSKQLRLTRFGRERDGAGDGNRTHVCSLEGCRSTIELHPQRPAV